MSRKTKPAVPNSSRHRKRRVRDMAAKAGSPAHCAWCGRRAVSTIFDSDTMTDEPVCAKHAGLAVEDPWETDAGGDYTSTALWAQAARTNSGANTSRAQKRAALAKKLGVSAAGKSLKQLEAMSKRAKINPSAR